jgi:ATP-dependent RNA helicase DDX18/HAS1
MGIKGKRKRERLRLLREQNEEPPSDDDEEQELAEGDDFPAHLAMGGPFAPPAARGPVRMKQSELHRLQDQDVLEAMREEHARRKRGTKGAINSANKDDDEFGDSGERMKKKLRTEGLRLGNRSGVNHQGIGTEDLVDDEAAIDVEAILEAAELERQSRAIGLDGSQGQVRLRTSNVRTGAKFSHPLLGLEASVVEALSAEGFVRMTLIQQRVIPFAIEGYDILGQAKTGSGKTLAFVVPVLHASVPHLRRFPKHFVALVLAPTKELCAQIQSVASDVARSVRDMPQPIGVRLITGGTKISEERRALTDGTANLVVGTPGRLKDHVMHCPGWIRSTLRFLVLDEADRMLADGFQRDLDAIVASLPRGRQTFLFSATNSKSVTELARLSLQKTPLFIATRSSQPSFLPGASEEDDTKRDYGEPPAYLTLDDVGGDDEDANEESAVSRTRGSAAPVTEDADDIPSQLRQYCHIAPVETRLRSLYAFVKQVGRRSKAMVFCSTVSSTIFHCMMMGSVGFHNDVLMLHGHMKHRQRLETFDTFCKWETGLLFCTDVAARGLDVPNVEWILQLDPPMDPTEYVHRIGRTARAGNVGNALIFLTPQETNFVRYLSKFGIRMSKYPMPPLPDIQLKLEHVLQLDPIVAKSAVNAYRAHVGAYLSHILKETFDVHQLDLDALAGAFALTSAPAVSIPKSAVEEKKKEYVKGKLKSLNKKKKESIKLFHSQKTKRQWTEDGCFIGVVKPSKSI